MKLDEYSSVPPCFGRYFDPESVKCLYVCGPHPYTALACQKAQAGVELPELQESKGER